MKLKSNYINKIRQPKVIWTLFIVLIITGAIIYLYICSIPKRLVIHGIKNPLFTFYGTDKPTSITISEAPNINNNYTEKDLWVIKDNIGFFYKTTLEYGKLSIGYKQVYPIQGAPSELKEGRLYICWAPVYEETGWINFFTICNGQIIETSDSKTNQDRRNICEK